MEQTEVPPNIDLMCCRLDNIIITTCNDGLKGLTPQPTKFNDNRPIDDSLCYRSETGWPNTELTEQFKKEMNVPWPLCNIDQNFELDTQGKDQSDDSESKTLNIADITGPWGITDCRTAKDMRYLEDLVEEDDDMVDLANLVGPCGSTSCKFIKHLKDFIFHRGVFAYHASDDPKQCSCTEQSEKALGEEDCNPTCTKECEDLERMFWGGSCVHKPETTSKPRISFEPSETKPIEPAVIAKVSQNVHGAYYLTVEVDEKSAVSTLNDTPSGTSGKKNPSETKFNYCAETCPRSDTGGKCSKSACDLPEAFENQVTRSRSLKCIDSNCPNRETDKQESYTPSPADSDVEINLAELHNPCNIGECDVADRLFNFIAKGLAKKEKCMHHGGNGPCFCNCAKCNPEKRNKKL